MPYAHSSFENGLAQLTVQGALPEDEGQYTIVAENSHGRAESEDFHFERKGNQCSLFIQEVFPEDTGKYTCEAWNEVGEVRTEVSLTVQAQAHHCLPGAECPAVLCHRWGPLPPVELDEAGPGVGDCSCVAALVVSEGAVVSSGEHQTPEPCQRVGGVDGTVRGRGAPSSSTSNSSIQQQGSEEPSAARGLLKRRVETKEHREDQIRLQEAEQRDFRTVLGRKVTTKSISEEDLKEITAEQMDFRGQLQPRGVKPLSEDERKVNAPAQVDFRDVLGKKGGTAATSLKPGTAPTEKGEPTDFRSVLANKKNQRSLEKNGESPAPATTTPKDPVATEKEKNAINCVAGGIIDKSNNIGKEPSFSQNLSDMSVVDGACLRLHCQVTCDPPATITWTLDGKALPEDEGQYKCRAENSAGKAECSCMVLVDGELFQAAMTHSHESPLASWPPRRHPRHFLQLQRPD
ncbi:unnamed protein product, partial [Coregonus sp. 'balchen']